MAVCSINIAEMKSLVSALETAQTDVPGDISALTSILQELDLQTADVNRATPVGAWVMDELVPIRRRLAMAEAIEASSPDRSNFVQFDESAISTKTPAQAAADAKRAVALMKAGKVDELIALLSTEGYDPYFAKAFAQGTTPTDLESAITDYAGTGQLRGDVDPKKYEALLTGLASTLGLATRGTGDLDLGKAWTDTFLRYLTTTPISNQTKNPDQAITDERGGRSALMLLLARGQWSTPFLQTATTQITTIDKKLGAMWWFGPGALWTHAVTPQGKEFTDPVVALMAALSHNPEAARWAFTQGATTTVSLHGHDVPMNAFVKYVLVDHDYDTASNTYQSPGASVALLALQAAVNGDTNSPVALDVRSLSASLKEQKDKLDAMPWYEKWGHQILDVVGLIPVIGDAANIPNAAWYGLQGDWADAGVSLAGSVPLLGDSALGARIVADGGKALRTLRGLRLVDLTGKEITDGVDSARLLEKATQIEPAVFRFDDAADFRLAANSPHPNVTYEFNGIRYTTDEFGRPIEVSGTPLKTRGISDNTLRRLIGKGPDAQDGDVGFHLFAESLGGDTTKLNVVPGNGSVSAADAVRFKNLNGSEFKKMENQVRAAVNDPTVRDLNLTVRPIYDGDGLRPVAFEAVVTKNGEIRRYEFENTPVKR